MDPIAEQPSGEKTTAEAPGGAGYSVSRILALAVVHQAETGHWPMRWSGRVIDENCCDTWHAIDLALCLGLRSLPGGQSLGGLLAESVPLLNAMRKEYAKIRGRTGAGLPGGRPEPKHPLSVAEILAWADAHRAATGRWPNIRSGPVAGVPGENWDTVAKALIVGGRGLPGGTTLKHLLLEHRGPDQEKRRRELTVEQVLHWADAYYQTNRTWPASTSGPIAGVRRLSWRSVNRFLRCGMRGLPRGASLASFLREHGRCRPGSHPRMHTPLSVDQILAWADAHCTAHRKWPTLSSGLITGAPGERWKRIDACLRLGHRGLPGGTTLRRLLEEHRGAVRRPALTVEKILAWSRAHHAATGQWPAASAGAISGAPGETWSKIDAALRAGCRGLPGGTSLARLMQRTFYPDRKRDWRPLTIEQILTWADAHYAATGRWPNTNSGVVEGAPAEKWCHLYQALKKGLRGLPGGMSLTDLLDRREAPSLVGPESEEPGTSG
jgi:hypothetical protein